MSNKLRYVMMMLICLLVMTVPGMQVQAKSKLPDPPVTVSKFKLNKQKLKAGDKIKYSFVIEDVGIDKFVKKYGEDWNFAYTENSKGVHTIQVCWGVSEGDQGVVIEHVWKGTNNKNPKIKIKGELPIKNGMKAGQWEVKYITLVMDTDSYLDISDVAVDDYSFMLKYDFKGTEFVVKGTKMDVQPPTIKLNSLKLSKRTIKENEASKFSVKIEDESQIRDVTCTFALFKKDNYTKDYDDTLYGTMKYNKKKKRYEYNVKYDTKIYRKAQLIVINPEDVHGNYLHYYGEYTDLERKYYNAYKRIIINSN